MTATRTPRTAHGEPADVRAAYAWCRQYARGRDENFTVVSWFLPKSLRPHFFALYAFCRWTDDLGDEAEGDRRLLLDAWEAELCEAFAGPGPAAIKPDPGPAAMKPDPGPAAILPETSTEVRSAGILQMTNQARSAGILHPGPAVMKSEASIQVRSAGTFQSPRPLFVALARTVQEFDIPHDLFLRLIEANRMDQYKTRFESEAELRHYCEHSATPVGRMVLHVLGYRDERLLRLSDATCTALQLANFWQDVSVDLRKDRIYIPAVDMRRFGYGEDELRRGVVNDAFRELMRFEVARAASLFAEGRELERLVDRRVRVDVSLFRLGGEAVLDAIAAADYDVLTRRPRVSKARKTWLALHTAARLKLGL